MIRYVLSVTTTSLANQMAKGLGGSANMRPMAPRWNQRDVSRTRAGGGRGLLLARDGSAHLGRRGVDGRAQGRRQRNPRFRLGREGNDQICSDGRNTLPGGRRRRIAHRPEPAAALVVEHRLDKADRDRVL